MTYSTGLERELGKPAPDGPHCLTDDNSIITVVEASNRGFDRLINWQDQRFAPRLWNRIQGLSGNRLEILTFIIPLTVILSSFFLGPRMVGVGMGMALLGIMVLLLNLRAPMVDAMNVYLYNAAARHLELRRSAGEISRAEVKRELKHFAFVMANRGAATCPMKAHMMIPRGSDGFPTVEMKRHFVKVRHGERTIGLRPNMFAKDMVEGVDIVTPCCGFLPILNRGLQKCILCEVSTLVPSYVWGISPVGWEGVLHDYLGIDLLAMQAIIPEILDHLNTLQERDKKPPSWGWS